MVPRSVFFVVLVFFWQHLRFALQGVQHGEMVGLSLSVFFFFLGGGKGFVAIWLSWKVGVSKGVRFSGTCFFFLFLAPP